MPRTPFFCPSGPVLDRVLHIKKLQMVTISRFYAVFVTFLYPFDLTNATKIKFGCVGMVCYKLAVSVQFITFHNTDITGSCEAVRAYINGLFQKWCICITLGLKSCPRASESLGETM